MVEMVLGRPDGTPTSMATTSMATVEPPTSLDLRFSGYCDACGTWDDHGSTCTCCGYAFTGEFVDRDPVNA